MGVFIGVWLRLREIGISFHQESCTFSQQNASTMGAPSPTRKSGLAPTTETRWEFDPNRRYCTPELSGLSSSAGLKILIEFRTWLSTLQKSIMACWKIPKKMEVSKSLNFGIFQQAMFDCQGVNYWIWRCFSFQSSDTKAIHLSRRPTSGPRIMHGSTICLGCSKHSNGSEVISKAFQSYLSLFLGLLGSSML